MRMLLQIDQISSHRLNLPINFVFNIQHLLLFLQLQRLLFLWFCLLEKPGLAALLIFEVIWEDRVTWHYLDLFAHYKVNIIFTESSLHIIIQYRFKAFTSQSEGGTNFW
jgi:hypothetical protein